MPASRNLEKSKIILSLGSNLGNREKNIQECHTRLAAYVDIYNSSSLLKNPAILHEEQPFFLNQVIEAHTLYKPLELLKICQKIEEIMGRIKVFRYGPRKIDIDIVYYQNIQMCTKELEIPHPGVFDRNYLQTLLAEIDAPLSKFYNNDAITNLHERYNQV